MIIQCFHNNILIKQIRTPFFIIAKQSCIFLFILATASAPRAQEYATDRLFMKELNKSKCRNLVEKKINNLKKIRVMTLEQEALLNQNIWSKLRVKLPLSPGEKAQLRKLKEKGVYSNNLSAKNIKIRNSTKFKVLRHKCK